MRELGSQYFLNISGVFESLGERLCSSQGSSEVESVDHIIKWPGFDMKVNGILLLLLL